MHHEVDAAVVARSPVFSLIARVDLNLVGYITRSENEIKLAR
jgi:hypothetical protein